jgi:simple sugar transport system ATP-binding protein
VPEDRLRRGLVAEMSVGENLILGQQRWFTRRLALDRTAIAETVATRMRGCDIRPPVPAVAAAGLSGGNQQKIVVARELSCDFLVLLAAQPTRGVDIGAIELIHRQLLAARDAGKAVLLLSADLGEVLALSDRIAVLYRGRLAAVLERREASEERLGMLMTGAAGGTGAAIGSDAATGSSAATGSDAAGTTAVVAAEHAATADSTPHGETEGDGGPPR